MKIFLFFYSERQHDIIKDFDSFLSDFKERLPEINGVPYTEMLQATSKSRCWSTFSDAKLIDHALNLDGIKTYPNPLYDLKWAESSVNRAKGYPFSTY